MNAIQSAYDDYRLEHQYDSHEAAEELAALALELDVTAFMLSGLLDHHQHHPDEGTKVFVENGNRRRALIRRGAVLAEPSRWEKPAVWVKGKLERAVHLQADIRRFRDPETMLKLYRKAFLGGLGAIRFSGSARPGEVALVDSMKRAGLVETSKAGFLHYLIGDVPVNKSIVRGLGLPVGAGMTHHQLACLSRCKVELIEGSHPAIRAKIDEGDALLPFAEAVQGFAHIGAHMGELFGKPEDFSATVRLHALEELPEPVVPLQLDLDAVGARDFASYLSDHAALIADSPWSVDTDMRNACTFWSVLLGG